MIDAEIPPACKPKRLENHGFVWAPGLRRQCRASNARQGGNLQGWIADGKLPADRVAALRKAFTDSVNDPELHAEVKKVGGHVTR